MNTVKQLHSVNSIAKIGSQNMTQKHAVKNTSYNYGNQIPPKKMSNAQYFIYELINTYDYSYQEISDHTKVSLLTIIDIASGEIRTPELTVFQKITCFYYYNFCYGRVTKK